MVPVRVPARRFELRRMRVAVCVVAALFLLVGVLRVGFSRVVLQLAVGVVGFAVGGIVDALGLCGCGTLTCFSLRLYDHPHHSSLRCQEFLLHLLCHRPRA